MRNRAAVAADKLHVEDDPVSVARPARPGLFERLRQELRMRHYSPRTERAYVGWVRRFVDFHQRRHPRELGGEAIERFLGTLSPVPFSKRFASTWKLFSANTGVTSRPARAT